MKGKCMGLNQAALFDLDGVVVDTETQYSVFWGKVGEKFHPEIENFNYIIKGNTLNQIYDKYFPDESVRKQISKALDYFENHMRYEYINGVMEFIGSLRVQGIKTAVVTSSNDMKMGILYGVHPDFKGMFDAIVTADMIPKSKPDPECFLLGARLLGCAPSNCFVFEDSLAGLTAGRAAGMTVIGLSTTHPAERISALADHVIADFSGFTVDEMEQIRMERLN